MPATPPLCPGNPKGGHWWICDDSTGRFSTAYCKLCPAIRNGEDSFANTYDESTAEYGYLDGNQRKGKKRVKREPGSSLTADERSKRHIFYEAHREEIVAVYTRLKGNVKATALELSKQWKVELPSTTLHGLLLRWEIPKEPEPKAKVKKVKGKKRKVKTSQVLTRNQLGRFVEVEKRIEKAGIVGDLTCLERTADGHIKATVLFGSDAELMLGLILVGKT
jgi:hypothetical protein